MAIFQELKMEDKTLDGQLKCNSKFKKKMSYKEIPVRHQKLGVSKISGTIKGTLYGYKILTWIFKFYFSKWK